MLPPLPLAGDVTVSKDFNLSVASVDLDSPESAPPVVISGSISRAVLRVCVLRWSDGSRERVGASTLSPENQTHREVRSARALERAVYVTHVEIRPVITP
ncbi:unnamed protein product [Arctogadus glacialis]